MKRIAIVDKVKCKNRIDCPFICGGVCPVNRTGKECIVVGADNKPKINEELCVGCGICTKKCPHEAIKIVNLPDELKSEPIHRYGENQFALYSLPTPIFGKVVGILGKNGIGKSTAIKILAGVLKPNFGRGKEASYDELIDFFKGTEAQIFFEKIKKGEIKISYKPQNVEVIPKQFSGKVRDLLKKVDEKGEFELIVKKLEIDNILDSDIKNISGGELQKVAIAATALKKANLYLFDEPTSYLDIKQRIKISKFIKELANPETAVLVIEHDLIILDHITDLVHLMYGKEGVFGVVSLPKTTRVGINIYLSGFLREENIRFRDYEIGFVSKPPFEKKKEFILTSWQNINKRLDNFYLEAKEGVIYRNETIGVLGENGIGKTTFVKILADAIKADSGSINNPVKVSYKPQYIDTDSEELVINFLSDAVKKYDVDLIRPLDIKPLLLKKMNELSGGELQRVMIAKCLSENFDLALLDEPSAYLDVEQRLIVSKVIRDIMEKRGKSCLVVDHDLLFIDYLSNSLLVFEGQPALRGSAKGPFGMEEGMNVFLSDLGITMRRDLESKRPRINKLDSQLDRQQKAEGKYYYV